MKKGNIVKIKDSRNGVKVKTSNGVKVVDFIKGEIVSKIHKQLCGKPLVAVKIKSGKVMRMYNQYHTGLPNNIYHGYKPYNWQYRNEGSVVVLFTDCLEVIENNLNITDYEIY